jgi:guanylate kinase
MKFLTNAQARRCVLVLSGPSGAGKTTIEWNMVEQHDTGRMISHTSRPPRAEEVNGQSYFFLAHEEWEKQLAEGLYIEHALYDGKGYALSHAQAWEATQGGTRPAIVILNTDGALQIRDLWPDVWSVWVDPPSLKEAQDRMLARGDNPEAVARRITTIEGEQRDAEHLGYTFRVVNNNLESAIRWVSSILQAMKARV